MVMLPAIRTDTRWINEFNTFGTAADPITRTIFGHSARVERTELESLYRHNWVARAVVDDLAEDATREWLRVTAEDESVDTEALQDLLEELDTQAKMLDLIRLSRLYGGAVMVLGAYDGQQLEEPLNEERVNWMGFLLVVDRWQLFPNAWYRDPSHPQFGKPSHYFLQPITQGQAAVTNFVVHESRLIRLDGEFIPIRMRLRNVGWGDSVMEPAYEAIKHYGVSAQAGASLLEDFVLKVYKMQDLPEKLGAGQTNMVHDRMQLAAGQMSLHGMTVIGPDDDLTRLAQPVQGLFRIMEQYVDYVAGAAREPKTRLFGSLKSVLGGNDSDAELRTWYDRVHAYQKNEITEPVKKILRLKAKVEGLPTEGWDIEWNTLWQHDDVTKSQVASNWSQAHTNWIQAGVLSEQEVAQSVFGGDHINFDDIRLDDALRDAAGALPELEPLEALPFEDEFPGEEE